MKKVLLTINNSRLSGIEKFTLLLTEYLDKEKYSVTVGVPVYGPLCEVFQENKTDYFIFNNGRAGSFTFSGIYNMFRHLLKNKYDVIHAQAGIVPCVLGNFFNNALLIEHKHGLDFTEEQLTKMKFMKLAYEKSKKYFTDYTLTGCKKDKLVLHEKFNYKADKVITVYNGLEEETEVIGKAKNGKVIIGTIGRLTYQKGQEYFIEAAKELSKGVSNLEFHIYGEGENFEVYRILIEKYKLEERVFLKGYTSNISETMSSFDIFILTSRYEGIPYVILEAMRHSVPIISTDVGGIGEIIHNMKNGILIEKENTEAIVSTVKMLLENETLCKKLTQNAKKDFDENYTIDKTIRHIEKIYELEK